MASRARPGDGDASSPLEPPERLVRAVYEEGGESDREWLAALPVLTAAALERWELTPGRIQRPGGRGSLVLQVRRADGGPAALKLLSPRIRARREHAALAHWDGWGAVRLLEADATAGELLLERLHGDVPLSSLRESKALLEAAGTIRRLWVDPGPDHRFATVAQRTGAAARGLRQAVDAEPLAEDLRPLIEEALAVRAELVEGSAASLLLHGRFRQSKVLSGERAPWLAVGPEPLVGEPAYDLARLARDRLEDLIAAPGGSAAARRRVAGLADSLEVPAERLRGWTLFRAVESGVRLLSLGRRREAEAVLEFAGWL
ncbi:aminoglycoside phosphotransferase family protein [Streptomyces sp. TP-A0874]|uniref:aminoglycoside phosphotransferase family protein n=1 Tax=Streptomyces sp. TP-A0874 TaxID=549819 RepID=UPI000852A96C|nr:aminoglycoside phosphotransferase family protein [Streptomyces sp. TP-A0874]